MSGTGTIRYVVDTGFLVLVGFDDSGQRFYNKNLTKPVVGGESGARTAQPVWINYMKQALAEMPNEPIEQPQGLVSLRIDSKTGLLSREAGKSSRFEFFIKELAPKQYTQQAVPNLFDTKDPEQELATDEELF